MSRGPGLVRTLLRWTGRAIVALLILVLALAATGAIYQAWATSRDTRVHPPPGKMVDVSGHRLHLWCEGQGDPTVIFEAPTGGSSLGWRLVQPGVEAFARACSYDRAGFGWSEPGPLPRSLGPLVSELHTLLHGAGVEGPYVLVGSSSGGVGMRLFAARYADEVAGMVLVDSAREDMFSRMPNEVTPAFLRIVQVFRIASRLGIGRLLGTSFGEGSMGALPPDIQPAAKAIGFRSAWADAIYHEMRVIEDGFTEARAAVERRGEPLLGDRPLVVMTRGRFEDDPAATEDKKQIWLDLQAELLRSSTNSRQVIAEKSGHFIQMDEPQLIVDAIKGVVEAARQRGTAP